MPARQASQPPLPEPPLPPELEPELLPLPWPPGLGVPMPVLFGPPTPEPVLGVPLWLPEGFRGTPLVVPLAAPREEVPVVEEVPEPVVEDVPEPVVWAAAGVARASARPAMRA
ncbi:hypothetical protein QMO56_06945 [Roseomonas sp. E05]|uniref:hypothetical protein n=1 Tax=Roseomonas sp. E05 TaxID=3046310 RepID=UPI0024BA40ED|nr:hypothetical protein [Roseomonas sp. E05]MDJ0387846.1 hypothetical protein [Roseomonas sp. E05]